MKKQDCVLLLFNIVGNFGVCIYIYIFHSSEKKKEINSILILQNCEIYELN